MLLDLRQLIQDFILILVGKDSSRFDAIESRFNLYRIFHLYRIPERVCFNKNVYILENICI